jgi:hypothetical protein
MFCIRNTTHNSPPSFQPQISFLAGSPAFLTADTKPLRGDRGTRQSFLILN